MTQGVLKVFKKEELLTVIQFSIRLGISRRQGYNLVEKGRENGGVLAFRFGEKRCYRIPASEIERMKIQSMIEEV